MLSWRDWLALMTGGRRRRGAVVAIAILVLAIVMHLLAHHLIGPDAPSGIDPNRSTLILVTGSALLSWSLTLSQAMEMVTRAFYARADLDLVLSSPASARKVFAVRSWRLRCRRPLSPFRSQRPSSTCWPMQAARAGSAPTALSSRWDGRLSAGNSLDSRAFPHDRAPTDALRGAVVAAVVGAIFVIGVQAVAILSTNTLSRFAALQSEPLKQVSPGDDSVLVAGARHHGRPARACRVILMSAGLLGLAVVTFSRGFASTRQLRQASPPPRSGNADAADAFRPTTPADAPPKEWTLLRRDPWLVSQTLMQVLYLLPPHFSLAELR